MKTIFLSKTLPVMMTLCMTFLLFTACEKRQAGENLYDHTAQLIPDNRKTGSLYSINTSCGHTASQCPNGCIHTPSGSFHVDCQGWGNTCAKVASLYVVSVSGGLYTATTQDSTDLTSEEFFNMPARSLYTGLDNSGAPRWLNIPAQLSLRDSVTRVFTFNGVFFSQQQVYKNK